MNNYTYEYGNNLYLNLTNNCTNACVFCVKNQGDTMCGNNLILDNDPTFEQVLAELNTRDLDKYENFVFCGFGEPTMNLEALVETAKYLKSKNKITKLNTNGHGSLINKFDITDSLSGIIDIVSVSLNECNATDYNKVSVCEFGEEGFYAMIDFVKACVGKIPTIVLTVVDIISPEHIEKCEQIAKELKVDFRLRQYTEY